MRTERNTFPQRKGALSVSNSKKNEKKNAVLNTLKFYLPVAWKLSKRYFIVSVINVIVQAVLPFIDLIFLPLLVDALCQPEHR